MAKKIKVNILHDMREALQDAAAYELGEIVNLRVTRIHSRPKQVSAKEGPPYPEDTQCQPGAFRHLPECQSECCSRLGARYPSAASSGAKTPRNREKEPQSAIGSMI